jgi:hypothetical protein
MPKVPKSEWTDDLDAVETDDLDPRVRFGGVLGHALARGVRLLRLSRQRRQAVDDRLPDPPPDRT